MQIQLINQTGYINIEHLDYFSKSHSKHNGTYEKYKVKMIDTLWHTKHVTEDELANFLVI